MKPLHVVKSREVEIDRIELQRLQENDPNPKQDQNMDQGR